MSELFESLAHHKIYHKYNIKFHLHNLNQDNMLEDKTFKVEEGEAPMVVEERGFMLRLQRTQWSMKFVPVIWTNSRCSFITLFA